MNGRQNITFFKGDTFPGVQGYFSLIKDFFTPLEITS